jgi:flavin-dependent dehydrogenase
MPVVYSLEVEFPVDSARGSTGALDRHVPEIYFCGDLLGYGWYVWKGGYINIGLGRLVKERLRGHLEQFVRFLREQRGFAVPIPDRWRGHAYRIYDRAMPKLLGDSLLLVGDAASLACPRSGEGIRPAAESGLLAAETIMSCDGRFDTERLAPYAQAIAQRFGRPSRGYLSELVPAALRRAAAAWLLGSHRFVRHVVLDRWFLHAGEPPLRPTQSASRAAVPQQRPAGSRTAVPT